MCNCAEWLCWRLKLSILDLELPLLSIRSPKYFSWSELDILLPWIVRAGHCTLSAPICILWHFFFESVSFSSSTMCLWLCSALVTYWNIFGSPGYHPPSGGEGSQQYPCSSIVSLVCCTQAFLVCPLAQHNTNFTRLILAWRYFECLHLLKFYYLF